MSSGSENKISLWQIFLVFVKIGAFTIGGGYVMVPAIEAEMRRHKWIPDEELPDIVAISQSAPGLLTANMAIFAGNRLRGVAGSVVATLGVILAPFAVILAIAMFFRNVGDSAVVGRIFSGVRPVAVAVISGYFVKLLLRNSRPWQLAVAFAVLALMVFFRISAVYVVLATIIAGTLVSYLKYKDRK